MASKANSGSSRVSVILPVYNGAASIERALRSVFDQTFTDFEIVVVDDGSTDDTPSVLANFAERIHGGRIRIIRQSNRGFPGARNTAIAASRGELIALIDHDDQWTVQKLELNVAALDKDPSAALVYSDLVVVNEADEESRSSPIGSGTAHAPTMDEMLARMGPIMPSTVVMPRAAFDRPGGFGESLHQNRDFWLLMHEHGSFIYLLDNLLPFTFGH